MTESSQVDELRKLGGSDAVVTSAAEAALSREEEFSEWAERLLEAADSQTICAALQSAFGWGYCAKADEPSKPASEGAIYIVFDGLPKDQGRFIETAWANGDLAHVGEWQQDGAVWRFGPFYTQPPEDDETLEEGDLARLKSGGGPTVVVGRVTDSSQIVEVYFGVDGRIGAYDIPVCCLQKVPAADPSDSADSEQKSYRILKQLAERAAWGDRPHVCGTAEGYSPAELATQIRQKLDQAEQLAKDCAELQEDLLTEEQAKLLTAWRERFFLDSSCARQRVSVLQLRLWGHEIRQPELRAIADGTEICKVTAELVAELAKSSDDDGG